jgi:3-dehydroquinate synthase
MKKRYRFSGEYTDYYFNTSFANLETIVDSDKAIIVTDENVFRSHKKRLDNWNVVVLKPGEEFKVQSTVDDIIAQFIHFEADRSTFVIGMGGGVITDLAGYAASVYMRGVPFGFVPTSLLAMVDASIGGKNGIDVGVYKNLVGVIRQPRFLLYDPSLLQSLPEQEWINGFAEIIKHAAILDKAMFRELEKRSLEFYRKDPVALAKLITRNAAVKSKVVMNDQFEKGERRLLNFGHTLGHAIEQLYELSHGQAISIGMIEAAKLSEHFTGFAETRRLAALLDKYGLPVQMDYDRMEAFDVLRMDKKRNANEMRFILLNGIGEAIVKSIPLTTLSKLIKQLN